MWPNTSIWTAFRLVCSTTAQSQSRCVTSCATSHPKATTCQGDETGQALADCTCTSFQGRDDPLIARIKKCPTADIAAYAAAIPAECQSMLFSGISAASSSSTARLTQTEFLSAAATTSSSDGGFVTTITPAPIPTFHATTTAAAASSTHRTCYHEPPSGNDHGHWCVGGPCDLN